MKQTAKSRFAIRVGRRRLTVRATTCPGLREPASPGHSLATLKARVGLNTS